MIAALFVDADGVYSGRPDVDLWPIDRDARLYPGPYSTVSHPPCERWGNWFWRGKGGTVGKFGDDDGCFDSALRSTRTYGGVLEHPAGSGAWPAFGLQTPQGRRWARSLLRPDEWTCEIYQGAYGHEAPKRTWLLYVGPVPPPMDWTPLDPGGRIEMMPSAGPRRRRTPPALAEALIGLASAIRVAA